MQNTEEINAVYNFRTTWVLGHIGNEFGDAQYVIGKAGSCPSTVGSGLRAARPRVHTAGACGQARERGCPVFQRQLGGDAIGQAPLIETRLPKKNYISSHFIMWVLTKLNAPRGWQPMSTKKNSQIPLFSVGLCFLKNRQRAVENVVKVLTFMLKGKTSSLYVGQTHLAKPRPAE